ncbi:MAG TPA: NAD(P)H-dependent oxidoreductase, partial [Pseudonocardia sp.]|nr:NAD(P)H-dependent oxidoreductase [Pseudonocardia sp.]
MSVPHVLIVVGSTREGRVGATVGRWFADIAAQRTDLTTELVDLKDWDLPLLTTPVPPMMAPPADELGRRWAETIAAADGYVLVTPEYNHGYPAALKNALDLVFGPWNRKPVAFVGYGGPAGGVRAVEQLRQVVVELEMVPLRHQVAVRGAYAAFDAEGRPHDPDHARDAGRVLDELAWWAAA